MFTSILTGTTSGIDAASLGICLLASIVCGLITAFAYRYCEHPSKNLLVTVALLPAIVQMVILMVNGNLGVGVAVAGSFSLVRFRSLPGKASDILIIFIAMALGLCTGMGFVVFALVLAVVLACVLIAFQKLPLLTADPTYRSLRVTIPEDLDYITVFDEVFAEYTKKCDIQTVKTINLGTMYQIGYDIELKNVADEKKMIDQLRIRNGNLPVICSHTSTINVEL